MEKVYVVFVYDIFLKKIIIKEKIYIIFLTIFNISYKICVKIFLKYLSERNR